jgi:V/A-type H+-transporting ATPase subunit A
MGEFGRLRDPRTGGALMDRTVILCNTSAMPVAAREASIHMGATIAEYYRHMGLSVLLLADSTSRWAQALRETSGRLEEIPGEEAYPAYLASEIKTFYERAGVVETPQGEGSLTIIGTVSPAGGNFEEPVTQATLSTVKCFLGLSAERAYRRAYPAIDPLLSWSRYREQIASALAEIAGADWAERIARALALLRRGEDIAQMMKVAGDEGVSLDDAVTLQKAQFLDAAFLQQDAFDAVDAAVPFPQQVAAFNRIDRALQAKLTFEDREAARTFFTRLTAAAKALNTAQPGTPEHQDRAERFDAILAERA